MNKNTCRFSFIFFMSAALALLSIGAVAFASVPDMPSNPDPADESVVDPSFPILSVFTWACSSPSGNPLEYDIYIDTDQASVESKDEWVMINYEPITLESFDVHEYYYFESEATYYWRVVARDTTDDSETDGPVWSFSTIRPGIEPIDPSPADSSEPVDHLDLEYLTWQCPNPDGHNVVFDVYFWSESNDTIDVSAEGLSVTSYYIGDLALNYGTVYGWYVVARDLDAEVEREGPDWFFQTTSYIGEPRDPFPADGESEFDHISTPFLTWECSNPDGHDLSYTVYLWSADDWGWTLDISAECSEPSFDVSDLLEYGTAYEWFVVAHDLTKGYEIEGDLWSFTTVSLPPPGEPSDPSPADDPDTMIAPPDKLQWQSTTSTGNSIKYEVYFSSSSDKVANSSPEARIPSSPSQFLSSSSCDISDLQGDTRYYWKVVAWDSITLAQTEGPMWTFRTVLGPDEPGTPLPEHQNISVDPAQTPLFLSFQCSNPAGNPLVYDVYFNKGVGEPDTKIAEDVSSATAEIPYLLDYGAVYSWRVVAKDTVTGLTGVGSVWQFTTIAPSPPIQPENPMPSNDAVNRIYPPGVLTWDCSSPIGSSLKYDVYFSTIESRVQEKIELIHQDLSAASASSPTHLLPDTIYYWRVVAKDTKYNIQTTGEVWAFRTEEVFVTIEDPDPPNDAENRIHPPSVLTWNCSSPIDSSLKYDVYFSTIESRVEDKIELLHQDISVTSASSPTHLLPDTIYYWRVVAKDTKYNIQTTGDVWAFRTEQVFGTINVVFLPVEIRPHVTGVYVDGVFSYLPVYTTAGEHTITFEAIGNWTTPAPQYGVIVADGGYTNITAQYVDNEPPDAFDLLLPSDGAIFSGNSISFSWQPSNDQETGLYIYEIHISGPEDIVRSVLPNTTSVMLNDIPDGNYTWHVVAKDNAGNSRSSVSTRSFDVSSGPPLITLRIKDVNGSITSLTESNSDVDRRAMPKTSLIEALVQDGNGVSASYIEMKDEQGAVVFSDQAGGTGTEYTITSGPIPLTLQHGRYTISVNAEDSTGMSSELVVYVEVFDSLKIKEGEIYSYPNPFRQEEGAAIYYELTDSAKIDIFVYDMGGRVIWRKMCIPPDDGTHTGKNYIHWDGQDMFGNYVANGAYYYFIVADGKVLGRGEMCAYR